MQHACTERICSSRCPRVINIFLLAAVTSSITACRSTRYAADDQRPADLVIVNARVWTGAENTMGVGNHTAAEPTAILIRGERINAVGSNLDVWSHVGSNTKVIDAAGRRVIPGLTDSHTHIVSGGFQLARLNLRDVQSKQAFIDAVTHDASAKQPGQWVRGGRWSVESWKNPESPTRHWLDPVTGDTPVFLSRMDGHQALVNTAALSLAGIDASGPADPKGGEIEREPGTGEPTGILKESAMGLVGRHIPYESEAARYEALLRAMKHANSLGVTAVHDMCDPDDVDVFYRAEREGAISVRITAFVSTTDWEGQAENLSSSTRHHHSSDWIRIAGFKGYMDGSLGSRTAYMREPYTDAAPDMPYPQGQLTAFADPWDRFAERVAWADKSGFQVAVHAIGDEANHLLLNAYEHAQKQNGTGRAQHRVEHTQHLHVTDIPRFARLGVVASMQPFHKADDGRYAEKAIGSARLAGSYAFRQLADAGAIVAFGSDWPVVTLNPFAGIDSAVNAKTLAGEVWLSDHSLTVEEALRAYTIWPAKAIHRDDRFGSIEPGKCADIVILADDPLTMPRENLADVRVDVTIVNGQIVFARETGW
jgi:hypothetical protein